MDNARVRIVGGVVIALALAALGWTLLAVTSAGSPAARAETGQKALVLDSSVNGGATSPEAVRATALGFAVTVVNGATWSTMTAAQFADYQLVIAGDPACGALPQAVTANAQALADAVMARAGGNTAAGNRVLIGTDPVFHLPAGGDRLVDSAIDFAGVQDGATGLYLSFSCVDPDFDASGSPDGVERLLPLLTIDPSPHWTENTVAPCGGDVSLISAAAQFSTLTSAALRGWGCSVHMTFPAFPTDWAPLAVATDVPTAPTCGTDVDTGTARCGEAYVLVAGKDIVAVAPNLSLDPPTAINPVGTTHTVTAKVTNADTTPRAGVIVSFLVTGANAGAAGTCVPATARPTARGRRRSPIQAHTQATTRSTHRSQSTGRPRRRRPRSDGSPRG